MLNRNLRWALGATLVLTGGALLMPDDRQSTDAGVRPSVPAQPDGRAVVSAGSAASAPLPSHLERPGFAPSDRDPFAVVAPPAPPAPVALPTAPMPVVAPPPPPPPAFTARYVAQLVEPDGKRVLYFRDGDQLVVMSPGVVLQGGFKVQGLVRANPGAAAPGGQDSGPVVAVEVLHPSSDGKQVISLPPLPLP